MQRSRNRERRLNVFPVATLSFGTVEEHMRNPRMVSIEQLEIIWRDRQLGNVRIQAAFPDTALENVPQADPA